MQSRYFLVGKLAGWQVSKFKLTFNLQPSTFNPQTFNLQPSTFNLQPSTFNSDLAPDQTKLKTVLL